MLRPSFLYVIHLYDSSGLSAAVIYGGTITSDTSAGLLLVFMW
jgi:hypothetical protein